MRMALLGASGCGKSVTLKCIAGIMTPDRGHIILDGETLFDSEKHINLPPQKRRIGYLFQQYALFPNMTVLQNIRCGIRSGSRAVPARKSAGKHGTRRENDRSVQSSRTNACATSESEIARGTASFPAVPLVPMGTVFADTFANQAFTPSV